MTLQTERLILRQFAQRDAEDLYDYLSDPEVVRFEPYKPMNYEETEKRIAATDIQ